MKTEASQQTPVVKAEWIGTFEGRFEVDVEILDGQEEMFLLGLKIAKEKLRERQRDINHVVVRQTRVFEEAQKGRRVVDLVVCAYQRF